MYIPTAHMRVVFGLSLVVFICALAGYGTLVFAMQQKWQQIYELRLHERGTRATEEEAFQLQRALQENKHKIDALEGYFLAEATVPQFIERLETIADMMHVSVHLSSLTTDAQGRDGSLAVSMVVTGDYSRVVRFVRALETMPLRTAIPSLTLALDGPSPADSNALPPPGQKNTLTKGLPQWTGTITFHVVSFSTKRVEGETLP